MDREQHVVEVMGDAAGEPADRLELLGLEELVLRRLAHGDVADGGRHQDPLGALERAEHDLDRELGAVLAPGRELDPGADPLGQGVGRGAKVVGDQPLGEALGDDVGDLLPDQLVALVAELLLGLQVEQDDVAGLVDHDHRVRRRLEQPPVAALHLGEVPLRRLAHGDVADGGRHQDPLGALERAEHDLDRELGAVLAPGRELDPGADPLGQGVGRGAKVVGDQPLGEALGDDVGDLLPDQLVALVAELLLGLQVEQDDVAGLVDHDHRVRRRLEQPPVLRVGVPARFALGPGQGRVAQVVPLVSCCRDGGLLQSPPWDLGAGRSPGPKFRGVSPPRQPPPGRPTQPRCRAPRDAPRRGSAPPA